jgi:hypothetical protein
MKRGRSVKVEAVVVEADEGAAVVDAGDTVEAEGGVEAAGGIAAEVEAGEAGITKSCG